MGLKYAYIDEFGGYGFNFENDSTSTHFIITAIIIDADEIQQVHDGAEAIRSRYFQSGEMKSSSIGKNHRRRKIILHELQKLPFKIYAFVCDKRKLSDNSGLYQFKPSFYKFLHNYVYQELRVAFPKLVISADELGNNDFIQSFAKYIKRKEQPLSFFDESDFRFENSNDSVLIQIADIVSGSLSFSFDEHRIAKSDGNDYRSMLSEKILQIREFPASYDSFKVQPDPLNPQFNPQIAETCYRRAEKFIQVNDKATETDVKMQIAVLKYLLFRFMNRSPRKYIPTIELIRQLEFLGYGKVSQHAFRNRIIAKLRDHDVVIASSAKGYKIPSEENELFDFVDHGKNIILPMLSRLKKCNDIIRLGTGGNVRLFERAEYHSLAKMLSDED
ncbi:MAG: DUF3800 domain-containing protein [Fibrobacter sp.]|nr:DUF3800 domain-containing protein [Fibrobacter sp.]